MRFGTGIFHSHAPGQYTATESTGHTSRMWGTAATSDPGCCQGTKYRKAGAQLNRPLYSRQAAREANI